MEKSNSFKNTSNEVRLLSFQTRDVLETIISKGVYLADSNKSREKRDYSKDVEQLKGCNPIWCFSPVGIRVDFKPLKTPGKFSQEDFISGSLFDTFRCEMSLSSGESLNDLVILEIGVDYRQPRIGITHNSYQGAVVIQMIELRDLVAVYTVEYADADDLKWHYPEVMVEKIYKENPLFRSNFLCRKIKKY